MYWPHESRSSVPSLSPSAAVQLPISRADSLYAFDGTSPHETRAYKGKVEDRFSVIFFLNARGWSAPPGVTQQLADLGFQPAASEQDAQSFSAKFEKASDSEGYMWWRLQDT